MSCLRLLQVLCGWSRDTSTAPSGDRALTSSHRNLTRFATSLLKLLQKLGKELIVSAAFRSRARVRPPSLGMLSTHPRGLRFQSNERIDSEAKVSHCHVAATS